MLLLEKDTENTVIVTCSEAVTVDDPYYEITFTNQQTGNTESLTLTEESQHTDRYNAFTITLSEDYVTSGSVNLDYGFHVYEIKFGSISDNTFPLTRCELGRAYVVRPSDTEYDADPTHVVIVYKK